jgi:hypothetical protein
MVAEIVFIGYKANYFNYINLDAPDNSGMLRFLTDELQAAEDAGDRVWIIGHVLSGWDGSNRASFSLFSFFVLGRLGC